MRLNIYNCVLIAANCTILEFIICRLIDCGQSFAACADAIGISQKKAAKIYAEKAEAIQAAQADFTASSALKDRPKHSGFIQVCTDHFARCKAVFSGLDWHSYCLARLLTNMDSPTKNFMRKSLGAGLYVVNQCMTKLTELGVILSMDRRPKPIREVAQLGQPQQYIYSADIHKMFAKV
jgi:hypothetical protein